MIVNKEALTHLKDFGLNTYESKIWTALLSRSTSTAGELSDIAHVPRSRSYDVLESLEKKGFIITKQGKPIKYVAVPPEEVIERVKQRISKETNDQLQVIQELEKTGVLGELQLIHEKGVKNLNPSDMSGSLKGRTNILNHLESMVKKATRSIKILTTESGFSRKATSMATAFAEARKRNVLVQIAAPLETANKTLIRDLEGKAHLKHSTLTGRFMLVDDKEVVIMLLDDKDVHPSYDVAIWIQSPLLVKPMADLFSMHWPKMDPIA